LTGCIIDWIYNITLLLSPTSDLSNWTWREPWFDKVHSAFRIIQTLLGQLILLRGLLVKVIRSKSNDSFELRVRVLIDAAAIELSTQETSVSKSWALVFTNFRHRRLQVRIRFQPPLCSRHYSFICVGTLQSLLHYVYFRELFGASILEILDILLALWKTWPFIVL